MLRLAVNDGRFDGFHAILGKNMMNVATLQLYALWTVAAIGAAGFCLAWWLM
ncbi:MAG: hypothetical protein WCE79_13265 [Xanthobacteraceae bacterium]